MEVWIRQADVGDFIFSDMDDGVSYRLIVCGSAKGEVWDKRAVLKMR